MKSLRLWKFLCLLLFISNVITLTWLIQTNLDFSEAAYFATEPNRITARGDADKDFDAGILRVYRLETGQPGLGRSTGRKDGPFEIWTRYVSWRESKRVDLLLATAYVETYNARMHFLQNVRTNYLQMHTNETVTLERK
jgi:hypothetical protein